MHKQLLILLLVITTCGTAQQSQSIIYDAASLMNACYGRKALLLPNTGGFDVIDVINEKLVGVNQSAVASSFTQATPATDVIVKILRRHAADIDPDATDDQVMSAYSANPFIKGLFSADARAANLVALADLTVLDKMEKVRTSNRSGGIGSNMLGNLVNGTADFLIKRAQEELTVSIMEKLRRFLQDNPEFDILFPATCKMLGPVDLYAYQRFLPSLCAAIQQDITAIPGRLSLLYDLPRYRLLNQKLPVLSLVFSSTALINRVHHDYSWPSALAALSDEHFLKEKNNYAGFIQVVSMLSSSLIDQRYEDEPGNAATFIHPAFIRLATHNEPVLLQLLTRCYLGLLWQHMKDIPFSVGKHTVNFSSLLSPSLDNGHLESIAGIIQETVRIGFHFDSLLKVAKTQEDDMRKFTGTNPTLTSRFSYYNTLWQNAIGIFMGMLDPTQTETLQRIQEVSAYIPRIIINTENLVNAINEKNYPLAASHLAGLFAEVQQYLTFVRKQKENIRKSELEIPYIDALKKEKEELQKKITYYATRIKELEHEFTNAFEQVNTAAQVLELKQSFQEASDKYSAVAAQLNDHGKGMYNFSRLLQYTQILSAIAQAENSEAVETILTTYALPAGSSRLKKRPGFSLEANAYVGGFFGRRKMEVAGFSATYGLIAPIGLAASWGMNKAGSFSAFLGVLDIGSTIRYKLDNQGKYQQDISLAGIVSPSLHLVYGFPFYLPLSLGAGCQWVSPVSSNTTKINLSPTFNAFLAVDIPMFRLAGKRIQ